MRTSAELREGYLSFFEEKGHLRRPSASLIPPAGDHSTLLTSAGMQPQMPFFLGLEPPPAPTTTTSQKVFRTPDIDVVGLDTYHLTFFEMLGNFSFGQYFKEGAIAFATEFIQERLKLDWDRIWVSVHAGDPELKLGPDQVAIDLWEQIGMPPERIIRLPSSENFWSVGGPGPCGPDSEIYYDWGEETGCGETDCKPGCTRCERFLEFWNLVFMEYELHADGTLTPLPAQNIDTGLGLERTARIVQDVPSVYDTDGFQHIMEWVAAESGVAYGDSLDATKAHRVLADHGRGMTFLVADGVTPSNDGRGYVLRRVIRRAVQQAHRIGLDRVHRLTGVVAEQMGDAYPELTAGAAEIEAVVRAEEERFLETLERGTKLFEELAGGDAISAEDAFTLQATYGFPVELTVELAEERGQAVDIDGYRKLMAEHREISRAGGGKGDTQRAAEFARAAGFATQFVGYEKTEVLTQIGALEELGDGLFLAKLRESPFYPEGGGQVSDLGEILHEETGAEAKLREAFRFDDDQALLFEGEGFAAGDRVRAVVPWIGAVPDDGEPHRDAPAPAGAARRARRPREAGRLGGAPRQAALRLQPSGRAERRGARRGREARERGDLPQRARGDLRDADRGGAEARRDDALRREVRRRRPRRLDPGVLDRALRRHPRALDRRDRRRSRSSRRARSEAGRAGSRRSPPARRTRSCAAPPTRSTSCAASSRRCGRSRAGRRPPRPPAPSTSATRPRRPAE